MTERGRRPFDFYETPRIYTRALKAVIGNPHGTAYAPTVGDGAIVRRFPGLAWSTNDWDPRRMANTHYNAARNGKAWGTLGYTWCIDNPPFEVEQTILENALRWVKNVAMLARLSFLEPTYDRAEFWRRYGERCTTIVLPRYPFRENDRGQRATDNQTCVWLIWWDAQRGPGRTYWADRDGRIIK